MNISVEHKSYIIGFIHGDGNHYEQSRNRGKISIEISAKDVDILDKMENILVDVSRRSRTRDTNFKKDYKSCSLTIHKKEMRNYFDTPIGKKSKIIGPPPNVAIKHYIRGLFDADGSIGITAQNRPFWSLCTSSEKVKELMLKDIKDKLDFEKRLNRNKRDNNYNIVLYDEDAIEYASLLYHNATIYLNRKYDKFLEFQDWKRIIPKAKGKKKSWLPYEDKVVLSDMLLKEKMLLLNRSASSIKTRAWRLKQ